MVRDAIEQALKDALAQAGAGHISFSLEYPPSSVGADYASNAALMAGKALGRPPSEIAEELRAALERSPVPQVQKIEIAGPGFLNFFLTRVFFADVIEHSRKERKVWGRNAVRKGICIMVEHTQPNPFKPFHIGHLMSNTIGESVARLMRTSGAEVMAVNYQGDVGLHVAKALWGIMQKNLDINDVAQIGEAYVYGNAKYEEDETAQKEIVRINKRVYSKDPEIMPLYTRGREVSLEHFEEIYRILGSSFEHYFFEGEVWQKGEALVKEGLEKHVFEESDGAVVYRGEKMGLHTRVFLTKAGLPTYETKEIGLAVAKTEYKPFNLSLTITAVEQENYFKVVFAALSELRPNLKDTFRHLAHGMMLLASGKMSSRKGNIITGESLIADMVAASEKKMGEREVGDRKRVAQQVGVAAIKYAILKQASGKNIIFDPEKSLSFEGDSGPYLQYAHTRACSILRKAKEEGVMPATSVPGAEISGIEKLLPRFPEIVQHAAQDYEPHYMAQYLTELAGEFNSWYAREHVLDGTSAAPYKLAIVEAVAVTLRNGLWLLGIEAPEEM